MFNQNAILCTYLYLFTNAMSVHAMAAILTILTSFLFYHIL